MLDYLSKLDRRWIFLAMFLAVGIPVLTRPTLPERPTPMVQTVFDTIENLPDESLVFLSLDYDPASKPELGPMLDAFVRHCAMKRHRMIFITLWPLGPPMIQDAIDIVEREFGDVYVYGENYVSLGFKAGFESVIRLAVQDLVKTAPLDARGQPLATYPIMRGVRNLRDTDLVISIGAGFPGTKEWVQYASTPFPDEIRLVAGVTGVSAPPQYPYIPGQLEAMLPAIKGAAEYEAALAARYPQFDAPEYKTALTRMGPQLWAHLLMLLLIVLGNVIYFLEKRRQTRR